MSEKSTDRTTPFLKWAGGKQWLAQRLIPMIRSNAGRYIEPFLGGGSIFFSARPKNAWLSDRNQDLVGTYQAVKKDAEAVIRRLRTFSYTEECYYRVRDSRPRSSAGEAARLIYLNRTCWNGLYRVNRRGDFNVPMGSFENEPDFVVASRLREAEKALRGVRIRCLDFEDACELAEAGDTVYLDPPYTVAHGENGFLRYNELVFTWEDQARLAESAQKLRRKRCRVIVTNADHSSIINLYAGFSIARVSRRSLVASNASKRRAVTELLMTSFTA
jgi:DNA adenine methylase